MSLAVKPLSNAPSSLDEPTNIEFTEETLPAYGLGFSCNIVWRITTEIPSKRHSKNKAASDTQNIVDSPKQ
jgi:hypothetical protein